jgi:16S rRNA A1518/A1519 N6-dimethyltransferase RsmA/KsgA/DIM1 with predicted DNA glycosylase/AP lyase activity
MHTPRKRFGQHFLRDQSVIRRIVDAIHPTPQDFMVEIGPGQGALTLPVIKLSRRLDVIELDQDLIPELESRIDGRGDLIIHACDALDFDFNQLIFPHRSYFICYRSRPSFQIWFSCCKKKWRCALLLKRIRMITDD